MKSEDREMERLTATELRRVVRGVRAAQVYADPEASTVQGRPCYRDIRKSDRLPVEAPPEPVALIKLFDPTGAWTWYITAYDPETRTAWGMVDGFERECGSIYMPELINFRGRFGLQIERDLNWKPKPLSKC